MKYLAPVPKQFVDQSGIPLSDGHVYVYIHGDTQLANVYQDADGTALLPNPVPLDSNGAWVGFVTAGVPLDIVVKDAGGTVQFSYQKVVAGAGVANVAIEPVVTSGTKIAECWVDGELLELFAPTGGGGSYTASLPIVIDGNGNISNNSDGAVCTGMNAWAEGYHTEASGYYAHAEGYQTEASGYFAHAEGEDTKATYYGSHAEGRNTTASANYAHAEGEGTKASSTAAHAEGNNTTASANYAHAEGDSTTASGSYSHAEGQRTVASTFAAHASGIGTKAENTATHAIGSYNQDTHARFVVGNGTGDNARSDAFKVDATGDTWIMINGVLTNISSLLANL